MKKSSEKFVELAEKRVNKTIKDLRLIGNLANKANYDYENIDAKKNEVIVGNRKSLAVKTIYIKDLNLLENLKSYDYELFIKVRSTGRLI